MTASTTRRGSSRRRQSGRHRVREGRESSVGERVRHLVGESLVRNSAFLGTNVVLGSLTGLGTLTLLTRLYSVQAIGLSAAATSATGLITSISQLGLNYSLVRFLPNSRQRADLINSVVTATVLVALVASGVFLMLPSARKLYALGGAAFVVMFLLSTCLTTAAGQLQNVFVSERTAGKLVRANVFENLTRLTSPAVFVFVGLAGAYIAQGVVPVVMSFTVLAVLLARGGHRFRPKLSLSATRDLLRFSAGTYIAGLIGGLPTIILPLVILSRFGSTQNAYWYTAMAGASVLFSIPASVSQALLAEAAHRPEARRALVRRSILMISAVMVPVLAVAYFGAPFGLAILGHRYAASGLTALRWLIIAAAMTSVNYVAGTILYLAKKAFAIACINTVDAVVVLGLSLTWAHNVDQIAIAWVVGEVGNVILFALLAVVALIQVGWRWEILGGDDGGQKAAPLAALPYGSKEAQLAGLQILLSLATPQGASMAEPHPGRPPPTGAQPAASRSAASRLPPDRSDVAHLKPLRRRQDGGPERRVSQAGNDGDSKL